MNIKAVASMGVTARGKWKTPGLIKIDAAEAEGNPIVGANPEGNH